MLDVNKIEVRAYKDGFAVFYAQVRLSNVCPKKKGAAYLARESKKNIRRGYTMTQLRDHPF